ncbi:unnamed protein product [Ilex paraguariensis]|uniref:Uncharacterized protein n=1 Tax=Ilex paraguariensis TaxID=185542 RepID=A0ABC8SPV6_9AQUA
MISTQQFCELLKLCCGHVGNFIYDSSSALQFVIVSLSGWGLLFFGGYKFFTGGKKNTEEITLCLDRCWEKAACPLRERSGKQYSFKSVDHTLPGQMLGEGSMPIEREIWQAFAFCKSPCSAKSHAVNW